jgi:hypothetical protein
MSGSVHAYDIHGIITVRSEAALPELEKFRTTARLDHATIRVRLGAVKPQNGAVDEANRVRYRESPGSAGFAVDIAFADDGVDVIAAPLLRFSPHVLYTNIVEPILRWSFVERGYVLVHGACLAHGDDAFLITARTDTGKTTTMLRILDTQPAWSFLSDDLTLLSPEGRVLTYPKPLTISRHTLVAVKTPLLSSRERFGLFFQSRLHSKSGRWFGLFLTKTRLPMASTNALVQFLVPPPKYHVERLVPGVKLAREGRLAGLIVIDRNGEGQETLNDEQALEILLSNCEDAYGFPPYATIKDVLYTRNGRDLRTIEREIVARALSGRPATLLRSSTRDWWRQLPAFVNSNRAPDTSITVKVPLDAMPAVPQLETAEPTAMHAD